MTKTKLSAGALLVGLILFFGVNILSSQALHSARLDLTEEDLYTLSDGARNIASELDEPIRMELFLSQDALTSLPQFKSYATRVREFLEELVLASDGSLTLEVRDPEPFSEDEDRAVQAGLAAVPIDASGRALYFGLVASNSTDDSQTIPFFDPGKERFLEYDVTRLVYSLSNPDLPVVGLLSGIDLEGGTADPMAMMRGQRPEPWTILEELRRQFEVRMLEPDMTELPDDIDVLLLIHPKDLSDGAQYAIDQFVLGGGNAVVFVDPHCEADRPAPDPQNPMAALQTPPGSSNLQRLFSAWGLELVPGKVAADRANAQKVRVGSQNRPEIVDYVVWLALRGDSIDQDDVVTSGLGGFNVATAGILRPTPEATTEFSPLVQTSTEAMQLETSRLQFMPDPKDLMTSFVPEHEAFTIAARVSGKVRTAFPDGNPGDPTAGADAEETPEENGEVADEDGEESAAEGEVLAAENGSAKPGAEHRTESAEQTNLIVVADVDMLQDRFWITEQRLGPILLGLQKLSSNGDLCFNAIDNLCGSNDLISVRARGSSTRPFERMNEIRREADQRFLAREKELEQRLRDTEARIAELQREKSGEEALILSDEALEEIRKFEDEKLATRKELREVKYNRNKDIERLGDRLKWINILLIPAVVGAAAISLGTYRVRRRRGRQ